MRILIYSPKFYPSIGGLENLTLMLAREFRKAGHDVKVITQEATDGTDCGVETYYRPSAFKILSLYNACDVFYMPNISLKGFWLRLLNPFKKWVISHNGWYERREGMVGWQDKLKLFLLRFASANISVSKVVAERLPVKSTVIHNCYDTALFYDDEKAVRSKDILFVGRLVSDKGCDLLLDACIDMWRSGEKFSLTITGDGPDRKMLEEKVRSASVEDKVEFSGFRKDHALRETFHQHKIQVVPSKWKEPFGIVALEGLACGCKVLCSDEGGLPEAVGPFGYTFKRNSKEDLISKMKDLLDNKVAIKPGLRAYLNEHSPEKVAKAYLRVFES
jgi:glycosyltransferase involved in cell wall biosynthesis